MLLGLNAFFLNVIRGSTFRSIEVLSVFFEIGPAKVSSSLLKGDIE